MFGLVPEYSKHLRNSPFSYFVVVRSCVIALCFRRKGEPRGGFLKILFGLKHCLYTTKKLPKMYHSLGQLCLHWQHRQNSCIDAEGWDSCLIGRIIPLTHKNTTNKQNSNLSRPHQSNLTIWTTTLTMSVRVGFRITAENSYIFD